MPYHIFCTVSAEAPYSPLPVRGLLEACHEDLRPDLPKPLNGEDRRAKCFGRSRTMKTQGRSVLGEAERRKLKGSSPSSPLGQVTAKGEGYKVKQEAFARTEGALEAWTIGLGGLAAHGSYRH